MDLAFGQGRILIHPLEVNSRLPDLASAGAIWALVGSDRALSQPIYASQRSC